MRNNLPNNINPWTLAKQGTRLQGRLPRASLRRLPDYVCALTDEPRIDWQFGIDREGQAYISGQIEAQVSVICQRCLEPCELLLGADVCLGIVVSEEAAVHLTSAYEPLIATAEFMLADAVEDELLLLLPAFPHHLEGGCQMPAISQPSKVVEIESRRPFGALQALWQRNQSESS
jgi:uncharacterized protein